MKCPKNCSNCFGTTDEITCTSCESCYILDNGRCKLFNLINELCLTCDIENDKCKECDEGAYLSQEKICKICGPNIKKCHENNNKMVIDECFDGYKISGGKCLKDCQIGNFYKCLSCKNIPGEINQCAQCNEGFYLPSDSTNLEECTPCPQGCLKCSGTLNNTVCTECLNEYMKDFTLFNGKCIKNCNRGSDELCSKCNTNPGLNSRCSECNSKYYLPEYSTDINYNLICKRCPNFCTECYGDYNNPVCTRCEYNYVLRQGECRKGCYFLIGNCLACDDLGEYRMCTKCEEGYYFPSNPVDKTYANCVKCSMPGCIKCEGETEFSDKCLQCESKLKPLMNNYIIQSCYQTCEIGLNNKCKSCSEEIGKCGTCNDGYQLIKGICYLKDFDFEVEYESPNKQCIRAMNNCYFHKLEINGKSINYNGGSYVCFDQPGILRIKLKISQYCSFHSLFYNNPYLKSITFYDNFDFIKNTDMNDFFSNCPNLEYVDLSNLDLSNILFFMNMFKNDRKLKEVRFPKIKSNPFTLLGMFQNCESLTSIDLSFIDSSQISFINDIFNGCKNLKFININNLKKTGYNDNIFNGLPENGKIIINKNFISVIEEQLPINWVVEVNGTNIKKTIFIAGDITAKSSGSTKGWGEYLSQYVSADVENEAFSGQTARTFYREGKWNNLVKKITKGDYVFIQFGHFEEGNAETNSKCSVEGKGDETISVSVDGIEEIVHTFPWYIKYFANQVLTKEGIPVLLSPTPEFSFVDGKISKTNQYQEYMKSVSNELKILYIDHYSYIANNMESLGENYIKENNWFPIDKVQTSPEAAESNAKMLINGIKCLNNEDMISILNEEELNSDYPCLNKE